MAVSTDLATQFKRIVEIDPFYLYMFPSNLEAMLQFLEDANLKLPSLRLVFTVAETVDDALRQRASRILGVEIADNYGATEGFIAWQCPQGSYHINAEHVLVELVDESRTSRRARRDGSSADYDTGKLSDAAGALRSERLCHRGGGNLPVRSYTAAAWPHRWPQARDVSQS